jgi:hypothetical protein
MKDTFCKREYKCKCGIIIEDYVWASSIKEHTIKCKCKKEIGYNNLIVNKVTQTASIRTPTKNR